MYIEPPRYDDTRMEVVMLRRTIPAALLMMVLAAGCDLLNPARPTPHTDTNLFGNLIEVQLDEGETEAWRVRVRIGLPRAFARAEAGDGKPTPVVEQGMVADILVTTDTVVLGGGVPVFIEDITPGSEVVIVPVPGSTRMVGTSNITVEANYLMDFDTYRRWQLPALALDGDELAAIEDPSRINSAGVEGAPVPVGDGQTLYFTSRLRAPAGADGAWVGARRDGLREPDPENPPVERTYRTSLTEDGWSFPELVVFPGLDGMAVVRVTWMNGDETDCLVTVMESDGSSWIGQSGRDSVEEPWGELQRLTGLGDGGPRDAVFLAGSRTKLVFTDSLGGNPSTDLLLLDPGVAEAPQVLTPPITTAASEWGPRVGPGNELFFVRGDRQFMVDGGAVRSVAIPARHRAVITQVAPTNNGEWVFLCMPHYTPVELDNDIFVAPWIGENRLGAPVPVDDWRP